MNLNYLNHRPMSAEQKVSKIAHYKLIYGTTINYKKKMYAKKELNKLKEIK